MMMPNFSPMLPAITAKLASWRPSVVSNVTIWKQSFHKTANVRELNVIWLKRDELDNTSSPCRHISKIIFVYKSPIAPHIWRGFQKQYCWISCRSEHFNIQFHNLIISCGKQNWFPRALISPLSSEDSDTFPPGWVGRLRHWGWDKMAAILQTSNTFLYENIWVLIQMSVKFIPDSPFDNKSALVQAMACMVPTRRQAIIWTNDGIAYWRIIVNVTRLWWVKIREHDFKKILQLWTLRLK